MAVKTVYKDLDGDETHLLYEEGAEFLEVVCPGIVVIPLEEITTFRDFINDELDRIEKEIGDKEQVEAEREHKKFLDNI